MKYNTQPRKESLIFNILKRQCPIVYVLGSMWGQNFHEISKMTKDYDLHLYGLLYTSMTTASHERSCALYNAYSLLPVRLRLPPPCPASSHLIAPWSHLACGWFSLLSPVDYTSGFGGKFGVQKDRQDESALGYDHMEKLQKHESQKGSFTRFM